MWVDMQHVPTMAFPFPAGMLHLLVAAGRRWLDQQIGAAPARDHFAASVREQPECGVPGASVLHGERISVAAYDVHGRLVRLADGVGTGVTRFRDGRLTSAVSPTGVYFLRVKGADREVVLRAVRIR
jgi:hypothetical protein